jgi:hypothetical protein
MWSLIAQLTIVGENREPSLVAPGTHDRAPDLPFAANLVDGQSAQPDMIGAHLADDLQKLAGR